MRNAFAQVAARKLQHINVECCNASARVGQRQKFKPVKPRVFQSKSIEKILKFCHYSDPQTIQNY